MIKNLHKSLLSAYSDSKDLAKRTISDKILKDRAYEKARNPKYDGYQRGLESMAYKVFDKKTGSGVSVNEELPQELHKPMIEKFKRKKFCTRFKDNIWAADLAGVGSLSSFNRGVKYLLCVIDAWVKPLKDKKAKTVLHGFIEIVKEPNLQPNRLWVDQGREFHNNLMQK